MFSLENGESDVESKVCTKCGELKPLVEFTKARNLDNTPKNKGRNPECKKCEYARRKGERDSYRRAGKPMIPKIGYPCQCCGRTDKKIVFDHCHETLEWRGWLCTQCNVAIGQLGDTIEGVERALKYLKRENKGEEHEQLFE